MTRRTYRIATERGFMDGLKAMGCAPQGHRKHPHRHGVIPFHSDHSRDCHFGFHRASDVMPPASVAAVARAG